MISSVDTKQIITNAKLVDYDQLQTLTIENNIITDIRDSKVGELTDLDLQGDYISLGGIDLQINGGLGLAFPDLQSSDKPKLQEICDYLWETGVDGFLPTIVTTSIENIQRSLGVIAEFMGEQSPSHRSAQILGVHLEGPCLNYGKRGAHPEEHLQELTIGNIKNILGDYAPIVKIFTLAPELDLRGEVVAYLHSLGITVSLGHSLATDEEAKLAFAQGASMVTHAFNAMPSLHHRKPGLLGEAIVNSNVYCGLIADGVHVHPTMIKLILEASNYEKGIFLVSDALSPIGLEDGVYPWDERTIEVTNGTARLPDGTLSGTTLPLFIGVENLLKWSVCSLPQAIALATSAPRKAIGMDTLQVGSQANLIRWQWQEETQQLDWQRI